MWSKEDEAYIASVPELPGCKADGVTVEEAVRALEVVTSQWIATAKELGRPVPDALMMDGYEAMQKRFQQRLDEQFRKAVQATIEKVMVEMKPMFAGARDPADYWKAF